MLVVFSSMDRAKVLVWNVRELNSPTRRGAVRAIVKDHGTSVICFQELKLSNVALSDAQECCCVELDIFFSR